MENNIPESISPAPINHKLASYSWWISRIIFFFTGLYSLFYFIVGVMFAGVSGSFLIIGLWGLLGVVWLALIVIEEVCLRKLKKIYKNKIVSSKRREIVLSIATITFAIIPLIYVSCVSYFLQTASKKEGTESYHQSAEYKSMIANCHVSGTGTDPTTGWAYNIYSCNDGSSHEQYVNMP